jgi:hypothetical protein
MSARVLFVAALALLVVDLFWFHTAQVRAQSPIKVYIQEIDSKRGTAIQGNETAKHGYPNGATVTQCYIASR